MCIYSTFRYPQDLSKRNDDGGDVVVTAPLSAFAGGASDITAAVPLRTFVASGLSGIAAASPSPFVGNRLGAFAGFPNHVASGKRLFMIHDFLRDCKEFG